MLDAAVDESGPNVGAGRASRLVASSDSDAASWSWRGLVRVSHGESTASRFDVGLKHLDSNVAEAGIMSGRMNGQKAVTLQDRRASGSRQHSSRAAAAYLASTSSVWPTIVQRV